MAATATLGPLTGLPRRLVQDGVVTEEGLNQALEATKEKGSSLVPFLRTYRTMCIAPEAGFRRLLQEVHEMRLAT